MEKVRLGDKTSFCWSVVVMSNWPIRAEIDPHVSSSKDTASMSLERVLSCRDLGHFGSVLGGGSAEADKGTEVAGVNVAPFDNDSGLDENLYSSDLPAIFDLFWEPAFT